MSRNNVPDSWRRNGDHYRLRGVACHDCERAFVPARKVCPWCGTDKSLEERTFNGRGKIISFTTITDSPAEFVGAIPYHMALIELDGGARITAPVVDTTDAGLEAGMEVSSVFRKVHSDGRSGLIEYGTKFRPVLISNSKVEDDQKK